MNPIEENKLCCLSYWFPKIQNAGVPVPRTYLIQLSHRNDIANVADGEYSKSLPMLANRIRHAAAELGGYPCFLRTGQGSGKHDWQNCCHLRSGDRVEAHIVALSQWSELVDIFGLPVDVWVVREMLPTKPLFRCVAYGGFPVVREFRVFVDGPQVLYRVPYWPDGAIKEGGPDDPRWPELLSGMNTLTKGEELLINELASHAGRAVGGKWSVDVLDTERGWFVTDMAIAERSYGWKGAT